MSVVERAAELVEISQPVAITPAAFGRPPRGRLRFWTAYWTTARIVLSYLSLRLQARFRSPAAIDALARKKHLRNARRVHRTIARLQGLFIKIGQLISIMTNFLPEEFRAELEGLQDQVPPRPYAEVEQRFIEEFGKKPRELFAEFEERPIASASIGQVHRARLPTGEAVAVKVQYPDIEEIVRIDLRALRRIFGVISWFVPYQGMEQHLPRDPRHGAAGARLPRRGRQRRAHRLGRSRGARASAFPRCGASCRRRASSRPSGSTA